MINSFKNLSLSSNGHETTISKFSAIHLYMMVMMMMKIKVLCPLGTNKNCKILSINKMVIIMFLTTMNKVIEFNRCKYYRHFGPSSFILIVIINNNGMPTFCDNIKFSLVVVIVIVIAVIWDIKYIYIQSLIYCGVNSGVLGNTIIKLFTRTRLSIIIVRCNWRIMIPFLFLFLFSFHHFFCLSKTRQVITNWCFWRF